MSSADQTPTEPAATQPRRILGLEDGWELVRQANYTATQGQPADTVTITARGEHPTGSYQTRLVQSPLRIWPPQYLLAMKKPDGPATQAITPFEVTASFKATEPVQRIIVTDAAGRHDVQVVRARD